MLTSNSVKEDSMVAKASMIEIYARADAAGRVDIICKNSDTKDFMKKFVNAEEGAIIYGISKSRIIVIAREAGAVYKVGNSALINTELFEKYLERFREPARELPKHTWNKLKEMTNTPKTGENS